MDVYILLGERVFNCAVLEVIHDKNKCKSGANQLKIILLVRSDFAARNSSYWNGLYWGVRYYKSLGIY